MSKGDNWARDADGNLLVSLLTGFATAAAPDGSMGVLRLTFTDEGSKYDEALQLVMRPEHIAELIEALAKLEANMLANVPKGKPN